MIVCFIVDAAEAEEAAAVALPTSFFFCFHLSFPVVESLYLNGKLGDSNPYSLASDPALNQ